MSKDLHLLFADSYLNARLILPAMDHCQTVLNRGRLWYQRGFLKKTGSIIKDRKEGVKAQRGHSNYKDLWEGALWSKFGFWKLSLCQLRALHSGMMDLEKILTRQRKPIKFKFNGCHLSISWPSALLLLPPIKKKFIWEAQFMMLYSLEISLLTMEVTLTNGDALGHQEKDRKRSFHFRLMVWLSSH